MRKWCLILVSFLCFEQITFAQADLMIVGNVISVVAPNPVHVGITINVSFSVQNKGGSTAGASHTGIYLSATPNPSSGVLLSRISLESLAAGTSSTNIQCNFPIPYTVGTDGTFYVIVKLNDDGAIAESDPSNNQANAQITVDHTPWAAQNIPYPIIFVHGLKSNDFTWDKLIDSLKNFYGWSYGGRMDFCLNQDGDLTSSFLENDYHDYTGTGTSILNTDDYYTVNFDVDIFGTPHDIDYESNQSAIVKQGVAIRDAIMHILAITGRDKVILVCHSMGGLAAREYLQNPSIWQEPNLNHHVAKLVTIGTPHGGSNATDFGTGISGIDLRSEAIRDLRTGYAYSYYWPFLTLNSDNYAPGVFLFGGVEDLDYMRDEYLHKFYNPDVNCDGDETGQPFVGINNKSIPLDLSYSCIIGIGDPISSDGDGDGVVTTKSANINNYLPVNASIFTLPKSSGLLSVWHTNLTQQFAGIIQGMDEPYDNNNIHAYKISSDQLYYGIISYQSVNSPPRDYDHYKINVPSNGNLNIQVYNITTPIYSLDVRNSSNRSVYSITSNGKSYINTNISVSSGDYYIVLSGIPTEGSYNYPYAFKCTFSPTTTYCNSTTNLTATSGTFSDGSGTNDYNNNSDCKWKIQPSGATSITLNFSDFDLIDPGDIVYAYDGGTTTSPLLGQWTGSTLPASATSTGGTMLVRFLSDASNTAAGWTANYTSVVVPTYCNGTTTLTSASGYFSDGSGATDYGNNSHCSWLVSPTGAYSVTLNFITFNTEADNDIINVYDGNDNTATLLGSYSGNSIPPTLTSSGGAMFVEFITNNTITASGWNASYTSYIPYSGNGIVEYEYWFNDDYANLVSTPVMPQNVFQLNSNIPTINLSVGLHSFHIRFKGNNGQWSSVASSFFYKPKTSFPTGPAQYEYWFDNNYLDKTSTLVSSTNNLLLLENLDASSLNAGLHTFHIRFKPDGKHWSSVVSSFFYKSDPVSDPNNKIVKYRYWFDDASNNIITVDIATPESHLLLLENLCTIGMSVGDHQVHFQFMDSQERWSSVLTEGFFKDGSVATFYRDADGDGYGNAAVTTQACSVPAGYVSNNTDCNDANTAVHPGAIEVCNGIDDNCDGQIDEGVKTTFYRDADGDGYGNVAVTTQACSVPAGYVSNNTDCNDANAAVHPGSIEICDGIDNNCDGQIDEGVKTTFYSDADGDGYGNVAVTTQACSVPTGYVSNNTDCNDANAAVHPGATEVCNGLDDNCNGQVDEGVKITFYRDADGDGYGNAAVTTQACLAPAGYVSNNTDCNDANAAVHPGATEVCNGLDDNCDGQIDEGVKTTFYRDADGDGYGNATVTTQACSAPAGYVSNNTDCNDANAAVHPGATEVCNGIDDNCDGQIDEGVKTTFYRDADGDGYGNAAVTTQACSALVGYVSNNTDCNDANAAVHPGATEVCNGIDDNCDGQIDEGVKTTFYRDADGDGYGNVAVTTQACSTPAGYVSNNTDCNDANTAVHPGATEICNGIDDNCDGQIDEGVKTTFYRDADGDGYGNVAVTTQACSAPSGYVSNNTDCNDANAAVHPGATEVCNGIDDNCNGQIDEGVKATFYRDADGDSYGNAAITTQACSVPAGYVSNNTDCNDANAAVHPGAIETCGNGIDDNCNGQIDEGCTAVTISIADATVFESAGPAIILVNLSRSSNLTVTVKFKTVNGTAKSPKDYAATSGTVTFLPGQTSRSISVSIIADAITEGNENFIISLSKPTNATIADADANVTITETSLLRKIEQTPSKEEKTSDELNIIVPNPQHKNDQLRIFGIKPGKFDLILTDASGKTVVNIKSYRNNWSMARLAPGIYFYQILYRNKNGEIQRKTGKIFITD